MTDERAAPMEYRMDDGRPPPAHPHEIVWWRSGYQAALDQMRLEVFDARRNAFFDIMDLCDRCETVEQVVINLTNFIDMMDKERVP